MKKIFLSTLLLLAVLMSGCYGEEPANTTSDKKTTATETAKTDKGAKDDGDKTGGQSDSEIEPIKLNQPVGSKAAETYRKTGKFTKTNDESNIDSDPGKTDPSVGQTDPNKQEQSESGKKQTSPSESQKPEPKPEPKTEPKQEPSFFDFANNPMMIGIIAALVVLMLALIWLIYDRHKMKVKIDDLNKPSPNVNTPPQVSPQPTVNNPPSTRPTVNNPPPSPPPAVSNNSGQSTIIFTGTSIARPKPTEKLTIKVGNLQNIGSRKEQQDNFCISNIGDKIATREKGLMAVVADGMGGLEGGATISRLVTETFLNSYKSQAKFDPPTFLYQTAERAEFEVDNYMKRTGVNGGSTIVAVMVKDSMMDYISVGDSHIYLLRGTDLTLINREHSFGALLMEKAARGEVDPNEPYVNPKRNALTAYIGIGNFNTVDRNTQPILLKAGDKILLCSDGVYNALGDDALMEALKGDPINAAKRLEQTILDQAIPSQDNFTAIILECVKA